MENNFPAAPPQSVKNGS